MSLDTMAMMVAGCSEIHTRADNQDRIFPHADALPQRLEAVGCFAVADGMGGTQDGGAAAEIAIRHLSQLATPRHYLAQRDDTEKRLSAEQRDAMAADGIEQLPTATRRTLMGYHFEASNDAIIQELGGPGQSGTTLSVLLLLPDAICMGHLGDSRIYLWRQGQLHQLTDDHNVYAARRQSGYIPFFPHQLQLAVDDRIYIREHKFEDVEFYYKLGQQEAISPLPQAALIHVGQQVAGRFAELHTLGKITSVQKDKDRLAMALGKQAELPPELLHPQLPEGIDPAPQPGDLFLLCTDGLCGILTHEQLAQRLQQIAQLFGQEPSLDLLHWGSQQLLDDAIQAGSSDNISLLVVAVEGQPSPQPQEQANSQEALQQLSQQQLPEAAPHQMPHSVGHDGSQGIDVLTDIMQPRVVPSAPQPGGATATDFAPDEIVLPGHNHGRQSDGVSPSQRKRHHLIIGILTALLALATWGWLNAPSSNSPTPAPRPLGDGGGGHQLLGKGGQALFWMPMPDTAEAPQHGARLRWRQILMTDAARLQHQWGLSEAQLKPLHRALQAPGLSYRGVVALWRKVPREPQDLAPFDAALLRATGELWKLIAPTYLKYLDEMKGSLALPKGHAVACNTDKLRHRLRRQRRRLLRRWSQEAAALFANDWRLPLLRERLLIHPRRGMAQGTKAPDTVQRLKRCVKALTQAHQRLQRREPGHRLLGPLHNRIQLHQAHIKQLRTKP